MVSEPIAVAGVLGVPFVATDPEGAIEFAQSHIELLCRVSAPLDVFHPSIEIVVGGTPDRFHRLLVEDWIATSRSLWKHAHRYEVEDGAGHGPIHAAQRQQRADAQSFRPRCE